MIKLLKYNGMHYIINLCFTNLEILNIYCKIPFIVMIKLLFRNIKSRNQIF